MPNAISSGARLIYAGLVLARHDALAPREAAFLLPGPARFGAAVLRIACGGMGARGRPGERLARAFEALGPAAIKLGQLLSTRADIFGDQFVDDLGHLKDRLPPFDTDVARREVEANLGRPVEALFSSFAPPVAAASLAQAHPATLHDGRKVAVKVLRPRIEHRVGADIGAMMLGARLAQRFAGPLRRLEPVAFAAAVARSLELELDLRLEAAAASELGEVMATDGHMSAPAVVWEGVGKRVLTLTWATGEPLSRPAALDQPGMDRPRLADNVTRAFLTQALDYGVFHADLHEGNLFVSPPAEIVAVDFGIVGRLGPAERRFLAEILWGFLRRDYARVAEVHFEAGYVPANQDRAAFAQALRAVGEPIFGRPARDVSMGRLLGQLFEITGLFGMHLRPELVLLQKTMVAVEGVARRIDPNHDIWAAARPVVERWMSRELSPLRRAQELAERGLRAADALVRLAETGGRPPAVLVERRDPLSAGIRGMLLGAALVAFGLWLAHLGR